MLTSFYSNNEKTLVSKSENLVPPISFYKKFLQEQDNYSRIRKNRINGRKSNDIRKLKLNNGKAFVSATVKKTEKPKIPNEEKTAVFTGEAKLSPKILDILKNHNENKHKLPESTATNTQTDEISFESDQHQSMPMAQIAIPQTSTPKHGHNPSQPPIMTIPMMPYEPNSDCYRPGAITKGMTQHPYCLNYQPLIPTINCHVCGLQIPNLSSDIIEHNWSSHGIKLAYDHVRCSVYEV